MTGMAPRTNDHLISANNAFLTVIDYQPMQINSVNSMNRSKLIQNARAVIELARFFKLPIVLSTVNASGNPRADTIPALRRAVGEDVASYDRTGINAWEDTEYLEAVKATGRKKMIILGLWTEACLTFPTLDAVGGTSPLAHEAALLRVERAGAQLTSIAQLGCELQRDWNREETVPEFDRIMTEFGAFSNLR